jgi:hypothetical protein
METLTPAPLMSLIIREVYKHFDIDLEAEEITKKQRLANKVCCFIALDIMIGNKVKEICTPLHITAKLYAAYISEMMTIRGTNKELNDSINSIKLNVLTTALMHDKYKQFLSSASKRTNINYLQIQN